MAFAKKNGEFETEIYENDGNTSMEFNETIESGSGWEEKFNK